MSESGCCVKFFRSSDSLNEDIDAILNDTPDSRISARVQVKFDIPERLSQKMIVLTCAQLT